MESVIKFSRHSIDEAKATEVDHARQPGAVTASLCAAATGGLMAELRKAQFANPKEDCFDLFMRVARANPHLMQLTIEPLLVRGYVESIDNVEEEA